jgi:hypothetical protein
MQIVGMMKAHSRADAYEEDGMAPRRRTGRFPSERYGRTFTITRVEERGEMQYVVEEPPRGFPAECTEAQVFQLLGYIPMFDED